MAQYKPVFLVLDGLTPLQTGEFSWIPGQYPLPLSEADKQQLWFAIPGAPTGRGKKLVDMKARERIPTPQSASPSSHRLRACTTPDKGTIVAAPSILLLRYGCEAM